MSRGMASDSKFLKFQAEKNAKMKSSTVYSWGEGYFGGLGTGELKDLVSR